MMKNLFYYGRRLYELFASGRQSSGLNRNRPYAVALVTLSLTLFAVLPAIAQDHVLTGIVKDEKGITMPGAAIRVKGTQRGATTDVDGKFLLEITNPSDSLQISFIGYFTLTVQAGNEKNRTFTLQPNEEQNRLNEVVVVGFGTQKKATVTGAVSTVSMKDLEKSATPSLSNALAGRLPGIVTRQSSGEPGYDQAELLVRGLGTWVARAPLVLVDGVPGRNLNLLNTQEIESFSILKDAAATAVYGVRGANGVILINTKRGTQAKPKVSFRSETASLTALRLPQYINSFEYASLMNEGLANVGQNPRWTNDELQKFADGSDPYLYPNVNWTDEILKKNTYQTINNLNVTGGNNVARYFANVGYIEQSGLWKEDPKNKFSTNANMKRYNFRTNIDINLTSNLTLELGLGGIIQKANFPGTGAPGLFNAMRITPPLAFPKLNPDGTVGGVLAFIGSNPWGQATQSGYSRQDRNTVQGTFAAKWDLSNLVTKGLTLSGRMAYDHFYFGDQVRNRAFEVKQYLGVDANGNDRYQIHREAGTLGYVVNNTANKYNYYEIKTDYNRTFGDHSVSGMILLNQSEGIDITAGNPIANLPARTQGTSGRLTYNYKEKYLIEGNFGYNGSENFPKGQRFGFFPSVSAGWVISKEKFWGENNVINQFKIRGSHGQVGNDQGTPRFLFLTSVNTTSAQAYKFGDGMQQFPGIDENRTGNPNVTWEVATKTNLGFDIEMYNGKVTLQVDAFKESREGILIQRGTIPIMTGFYPWVVPYGNLGKSKNKGIDALLELKNTTSKGLFYSFRGTFTFTRNQIIEADQAPQRYAYQNVAGTRIDQPFVLEAIGIFQNQEEIDSSPVQKYQTNVRPGDIKFKDQNGDGVVDDFDRVYTGYARTPEITFGFGGTVAYKQFDFSIFFNGAAHTNLFLDGASMYPFLDNFGSHNILTEYYNNRWTPSTPNAKYPAVINGKNENNYRGNTRYMIDGTYLRLRNAEIGYTLPTKLTSHIGLASLRIFSNGLNLYTWDKIKVFDPESNNGTGGYPLQRSINFGLQANFK